MSLQLLGPTVSPGGDLNALNPFVKGTSQWCTVLYYNVHSNIYRCVIMLSSGLFIRMSKTDCDKLLPSPKACNVLRCDGWRWVTGSHRCFEQCVPMCFAGWWWVEEEWREEYKWLKFMKIRCNVVHWEELHQYRSVDQCACKRMNFMLDSDQFKRGKFTFMRKKCELNIIWRETVFVMPNDLSEFVK